MSGEATPAQPSRLFTPLAVAAMVIVGVIAFLAFFGLSAFAPELRSGRNDGGGHALSYSATGFAALAALLRDDGKETTVLRKPRTGDYDGVLILTPGLDDEADDLPMQGKGNVLIVLPKWLTLPRPDHPGWVYKLTPGPEEAIAKQLLADYEPKSALKRRGDAAARPRLNGPNGQALPGTPPAVRSLQTLSGPAWRPLVTDEAGGVVLAQLAGKPIYVLSDPDLLNNQGLKELAAVRNAEALLALSSDGGEPYAFDVSLHGLGGNRNLLKLALTPPFLPATICALAAAGLMGFAAAARFGPSRRAERAFALGPEALAENSAGLIRLAKREHRMAPRYAALVRQSVARAIGVPRTLEGEKLTAFLDRLPASRDREPFSALEAEAANAANVGDLMRVARKLYDWKREMMRVGR